MLNELKVDVCRENLLLKEYWLVTLTWGNVSGISKDGKYISYKALGSFVR